jgi:hypothetical protein
MAASSFIQSNTSKGRIVRLPSANLTGLEGTLVSLNANTSPTTVTTTGANAQPHYVLLEGGTNVGDSANANESTNDLQIVTVLPLTSDQQIRVISTGTINGGVEVQSDASGQAVPASTGNWVFGITEEAGVAGQYLLIRPIGPYKK